MAFQPGATVNTQAFGNRPENIEVPHIDTRVPTSSDVIYPIGKRWIFLGDSEWVLIAQSSVGGVLASEWVQLGSSGGAISAILGTANEITAATVAGTTTLSTPTTFIAPGSIASTTTLSSGTTLAVGTSATVGTTLGVTGLTTLAALTQVGVTNINATGAAATTIGTGGTGTVTIGNTTGNTGVTGSLTLTTGNVVINSAGQQLRVHGGAATDFIGTATLVAGTVTVANTNIAATDRIMVSRSALNASPVLGFLSYTISAGASFTVASFTAAGAAATTDVSSFTYFIVRQV